VLARNGMQCGQARPQKATQAHGGDRKEDVRKPGRASELIKRIFLAGGSAGARLWDCSRGFASLNREPLKAGERIR
jgi:hypothetical protein